MPSIYLLHTTSRFIKISRKTVVISILILLCIILGVSRIYYNYSKARNLKYIETEDDLRFQDYLQDDTAYLKKQIKQIIKEKYKIKYIKEVISAINDRQSIGRVKKLNTTIDTAVLNALENYKNISGLKLDTVLVVQVHGNYRYVKVLLESLRRVMGIHESLLIFAHDFYDAKVYNILDQVHFARVMQIFYPYSVQLHPFRFPGDDLKFCPQLNKCFNSDKRDAITVQTKLFWWWIINEVFDHVEVLKNHDGYIYFLEVEQYLITDFILIAKKLEEKQPRYCPECYILSLAARPPRPELYRRDNSSLIVSVWGWSNTKYISSGFGLNRTAWKEIKRLKEEFCYFNDYTWENSLKHLASKAHLKQFYMLSVEGPRIFPTNDCTALGDEGKNCDIVSTYQDIVKFIKTTSRGLFPFRFKLEFDSMDGLNNTEVVEQSGGWEDARDRELCMFIASNGRRVYY